jgi:transposase
VRALLGGEAAGLSPRIRALVEDLLDEWERLDARIKAFDAEFVEIARTDARMRRLSSVPGIGPINATALVAAVGDASAVAKGRDMAAWLGLVPRQATTGGKPRLLGISKRGKPLPAQESRPRRTGGPPEARRARHADRALAARPAGPSAQERRHRGARQQAGTDLLGGARRRASVRRDDGDEVSA